MFLFETIYLGINFLNILEKNLGVMYRGMGCSKPDSSKTTRNLVVQRMKAMKANKKNCLEKEDMDYIDGCKTRMDNIEDELTEKYKSDLDRLRDIETDETRDEDEKDINKKYNAEMKNIGRYNDEINKMYREFEGNCSDSSALAVSRTGKSIKKGGKSRKSKKGGKSRKSRKSRKVNKSRRYKK